MVIHASVYRVLYKKLCQTIIQECFKGNLFKAGNGEGRALWKNLSEEEFQSIFEESNQSIFKESKRISYDHFYVKFRRSEKHPDDTITLDDELITNAFKFIPSLRKEKKALSQIAGPGNRAEYIHNKFVKLYKKEIDELAADAKLVSKKRSKLSAKIDVAIAPDTKGGLPYEQQRSIYEVLENYFRHISNSNYGLAWKLLSSAGKDQWSDFDTFKRYQLDKIELMSVSGYSPILGPAAVKCLVVLTWETPLYHLVSDDNFKIINYSVRDLKKFETKINGRLADTFTKIHSQALLYTLFKPNHFMFDHRGTTGMIKKSRSNLTGFMGIFDCICVWENKWRILRFEEAHIGDEVNNDLEEETN